jgi:hypothetical protein
MYATTSIYVATTGSVVAAGLSGGFCGFSFDPTGASPKATFSSKDGSGAVIAVCEAAQAEIFNLPNVLFNDGLYVTLNNATIVAYVR